MWRLHMMTTGDPLPLCSYHEREVEGRQMVASMFPNATRITPYSYTARNDEGKLVGMMLEHL